MIRIARILVYRSNRPLICTHSLRIIHIRSIEVEKHHVQGHVFHYFDPFWNRINHRSIIHRQNGYAHLLIHGQPSRIRDPHHKLILPMQIPARFVFQNRQADFHRSQDGRLQQRKTQGSAFRIQRQTHQVQRHRFVFPGGEKNEYFV